jgi:3-methyladenine DNA glycosylase AlkD
MHQIIREIKADLLACADEKTRGSAQRFFKEDVKLYGVKTAIVKKIARKRFSQIKDGEKEEIFELCDELFQSGYMEEAFIACDWSHSLRNKYQPSDFETFEGWVERYVSNWAVCDTLCNHTLGSFIDLYPEYVKEVKEWARSENRWERRAAAVSLIVPAKQGKFLKEAFEISDLLLAEKEDIVQKGYGWLLKEESRKHQKAVYDYVVKNKNVMPRTALRYAIELLPQDLRAEAMRRD